MSVNSDKLKNVGIFRHDKFCPAYGVEMWAYVRECGPCEHIAHIRNDERNRMTGTYQKE